MAKKRTYNNANEEVALRRGWIKGRRDLKYQLVNIIHGMPSWVFDDQTKKHISEIITMLLNLTDKGDS